MAGRKPIPTELKRLAGNPGKRGLNQNEPKPGGVPTYPDHLDSIAKAEWDRVAGELTTLGLLTSIDRAALAAYCVAWSRWVNAENNVQRFGAVIKSPKSGFPIANPYVGIANTAIDLMRKFASEFGMTPSSRTRLTVSEPAKSADPFAEFMASIGGDDVTSNDPEEADLCAQSE